MNAVVRQGTHALNSCLAIFVVVIVVGSDALDWAWAAAIPLLIVALGVWGSWRGLPGAYGMAQLVDSRLGLHDLLSTATHFSSPCISGANQRMRSALCEKASLAAARVRPADAIPLRAPRAAIYSVALMVAVSGLLAVRYRLEARLDIRHPMAPAFKLARLLQDETKAARDKVSKLIEKLSTPDDGALTQEKSAQETGKAPSTTNTESPVANQTGDSRRKGAEAGDSPAFDDSDQQNQGASDQAVEQPNAQGTQTASSPHGSADRSASAGQRAGTSGESNSLLARMSNTVSNLLSALSPRSTNSGQPGMDGRSGRVEKAQNGTSKQQGQASRESNSGDSASEAAGAGAGQGEGTGSGVGQPEKGSGSGAGQEDGNKAIRSAEQLAAMGKLSVLLGRRSESVSGSAAVEVLTTQNVLTTGYEKKKVAHRDVHASADRDEVPLELQKYVENYFAGLHDSKAPGRSAKKMSRQPSAAVKRNTGR